VSESAHAHSYNYDMDIESAAELGRRAIFHATCRDAYSGGIISGLLRLLL
jgi:20S proteasome subunit beta 5